MSRFWELASSQSDGGRRAIRHRAGLKVPRGWGWITNLRKAAYNRVYNRTTRGCLVVALVFGGVLVTVAGVVLAGVVVRTW